MNDGTRKLSFNFSDKVFVGVVIAAIIGLQSWSLHNTHTTVVTSASLSTDMTALKEDVQELKGDLKHVERDLNTVVGDSKVNAMNGETMLDRIERLENRTGIDRARANSQGGSR